jgi:hypothetical protein
MTRLRRFTIAFAALVLLAFADVVVLEKIYKPLSFTYNIPWQDLAAGIRWAPEALWWHLAFIPLAVGMFVLLGLAARDWRFSVGGLVLFFTGWEDTLYYVLLRQFPPGRLPWLDRAWGIAWTRIVQPGQSVSRYGLLVANAVGIALAFWIFSKGRGDLDEKGRRRG